MKEKRYTRFLVVCIVMVLLLASTMPALSAPEKVRVFVEFAPGAKGNVQQSLQKIGAQFHYTFDNLNSFVVTVPGQALKGLANNPNVMDIEEDVPRYPIAAERTANLVAQADTVDPNGQTIPWGIDAVQARDIWDTNRDGNFDAGATTGNGITVCIIDTGYYNEHEDLVGVPYDGIAQLDPPFTLDGYGHGTHVAGTIAAQNNSFGVVGVSPSVDLYIIKYFGTDGLATMASDLIAATNTCANNGAKVISMSLGGPSASRREERNFNTLYSSGILSIAAAGNDGNTAYSYPASYSSVVSVAAVDEALAIADFSQQNDQVEIAAPGVAVLSTLPYIDTNSLIVDGTGYQANHIDYSGLGTASGALVDGGLCTAPGSWSGAVVLCQRGDISFAEKMLNAAAGGGVAAVIYNNEPGNFLGTMEPDTTPIIGLSISQEDGQFLVTNKLGAVANVTSEHDWPASGYEAWNGTSMATPHVSAVAALLWSANPTATNAEIRDAMNATAYELGAPGRDVTFGYGLVQAADAMDYLGGGTPVNTPPSVTITSPANGSSFEAGTPVGFTGTASDAEDGSLSGSISWTSSLDGALGTGASISPVLSEGTHTITASVTDSGGLTDTDVITVTITGSGTGGDLTVSVDSDKAAYGDREWVTITVTVTDSGMPKANAAVTTTITTTNGTLKVFTGLSDANGQFTSSFKTFIRKEGAGTYTADAIASLSGYTDGTGSTTFIVQ